MSDNGNQLHPAAPPSPLAGEELYTACDPDELPFSTTDELDPLGEHLGQQRAVDALEFGLQIPHDGYNIFLLGSTGVGKRDLLDSLLDADSAAPRGEVSDWCYVNNFESPDKPIALRLPKGMATRLRNDMTHAVEDLLGILPATFQSDEYQARVQELGEKYQAREKEAFQSLAEKASDQEVAMIQTPSGYSLAPMKDGEIITPQDFEALPEEEKSHAMAVIEELKEELKVIVRQLPVWKKESRNNFKELNREFSTLAIDPVMTELKARYSKYPAVLKHLEAVHRNVMEEAEAFPRYARSRLSRTTSRTASKSFPSTTSTYWWTTGTCQQPRWSTRIHQVLPISSAAWNTCHRWAPWSQTST